MDARVRALATATLVGCALMSCAASTPRNLVLITLDTVRRDHLSTYGYPRETTPAIDALARRSVVFEQAHAQDTNTNPSHGAMFTGLYPHVNGNRRNGDVLAKDQLTMAERFEAAGYRTGAFVSGATLDRGMCGYDRGFERYDDRLSGYRRDGATTTELALGWLRGLDDGDRFFLFVHLFDAHGPYHNDSAARPTFRSAGPGPRLERVPSYQEERDEAGEVIHGLNHYVDRYDSMIRYADDQVARLLERIDLDTTVVVVIGDHGESLGERYQTLSHGGQLFDEQTRVPWIVHAPGVAARRVDGLVETTDLLPTVLELLALDATATPPLQGRSLVPLMRGVGGAPREFVYSAARAEATSHAERGYRLDPKRRICSVRSERFKLIRYPGRGSDRVELYDLERDPGEHVNVAERFPEIRDAYLERLDLWLGEVEEPDAPALEADALERLESLGYVAD